MSNKKKNTSQPHATGSFAQLVSKAQIEQLKPLIGQMGQQIIQQVYTAMAQDRAMMQTRQMAFERILKRNVPWFNDDILAMEVAEVEDEAGGVVSTQGPAKEGDTLRLQVSSKGSAQTEFNEPTKILIHSLMGKGATNNVQTLLELEQGLVGASVGDTKEFLLPEKSEDPEAPEHTRVKVTVLRISTKPVTNEVQTHEQPVAG